MIKTVILCGGSGTRLWPISRTLFPKQFVKLFDDKSLFQITISRNNAINKERIIVANERNYFLATEQMQEIDPSLIETSTFIIEPIGRNTAVSVALSAFSVFQSEILFVVPADHLIKNIKNYKIFVQKGIELAQNDNLVVFGIEPKYPEMGFGYIEAEGQNVKMFKEKPDYETAKKISCCK